MDYLRRRDYQSLESGGAWSDYWGSVTKRTLLVLSGIGMLGLVALTSSLSPKNDIILKYGDNTNISTTKVETTSGILEGINLKSRGGKEYAGFYNIPYAEPSVGEFRFEPPREFTGKWGGVRDATSPGVKCAQSKFSASSKGNYGSEDCHYLTVYAPSKREMEPPQDLLPVMVYLLGGAFIGGQASIYGGEYLMDKDVVLVLPESRFGMLGFLSTADDVVPGNMGFKDQVMALKWVQKNIKSFGGDPKRVTIFGNSSGAVSIHGLMMSNMSAGLFHGAISQSGSAITSSSGTLALDPRTAAEELGRNVGCPDLTNSRQLVDCLKKVDVRTLLEVQGEVKALVVEKIPQSQDTSNVFLSDTPLNIMREGRGFQNIPWILGVNSDEFNVMAAILNDPDQVDSFNSNWEEVGPTILEIAEDEDKDHKTVNRIREFYFGNSNVSMETRTNFTNMVNDRLMIHPTFVTGTLQAESNAVGGGGQNSSNVYFYWLSKRPIKSLASLLGGELDQPGGVTHADEVQYLLPYSKFPYIGLDSADLRLSQTMVNLWVEFATTGRAPHKDWAPIPSGQTLDKVQIPWFQIDDELTMVNFVQDRMDFWNSFPLEYLFVQNVNYTTPV